MKFILGKKIEMSQIFDEKGQVVPVTLIEAGPCYVTQIKTKDKDGYEAIQIGFEKIEKKKLSASRQGKIKKTMKGKEFKHLKEFSVRHVSDMCQTPKTPKTPKITPKIGEEIKISVFKVGDKVAVSGVSKGKGFAGVIKRWGFHRKPASHGTKHETRALGSVGSRFPQRVVKGRKMPGRLGSERVTVKNLEIAAVDEKNNILAVKGAVPGGRGTLLEIRG